MRHLRRIGIAALLSLLAGFGAAPQAGAFQLAARGLYWAPAFTANLRVDKNSVTGTELRVKDDLGVGDTGFPQVEVLGHFGNHRLSVLYTPVEFSGDARLARDIVFHGTAYLAHTQVSSNLRFHMIDAEYGYDLIRAENVLAGVSLALLARVKYIDGEAKLRAAYAAQRATFQVPVPMIGAGLHIGILANLLEVSGKAAGIAYGGNALYEAAGEIALTPLPFVGIHGGYRLIHLDVDEQNVRLKTDLTGPYLAVSIGF